MIPKLGAPIVLVHGLFGYSQIRFAGLTISRYFPGIVESLEAAGNRVLVPGLQPLTTQQVNDVVAHAMASATPPPAFSTRVYQAIRPSLVLVQTVGQAANGKVDHGLTSSRKKRV